MQVPNGEVWLQGLTTLRQTVFDSLGSIHLRALHVPNHHHKDLQSATQKHVHYFFMVRMAPRDFFVCPNAEGLRAKHSL